MISTKFYEEMESMLYEQNNTNIKKKVKKNSNISEIDSILNSEIHRYQEKIKLIEKLQEVYEEKVIVKLSLNKGLFGMDESDLDILIDYYQN